MAHTIRRTVVIRCFVASALIGLASPAPDTLAEEPVSVAGTAMQTIFSPFAAPKRKTMGLLQRNFLDMAGQSADLEVAIVVDGTDSMAAELKGIRESILRMLGDLKRLRGGEVRVAMVVYRDVGSPGGAVEMLIPQFSDDQEQIGLAVESLLPRDGSPFYYEMLDAGVHSALETLVWSDDPLVSKWILLFGDAPPYPDNFEDKELPKAKRRFTDEVLISKASIKGIQIHCVLCESTEETSQPHQDSIGSTRRLMDRLSSETGGMVLDLSYPIIRQAFARASQQAPPEVTPLLPITLKDLASSEKKNASANSFLKVAVLPHEPLDQIAFAPDRPAAQVATAMLTKFRQLPGIRVKNPLDVERQLRRIRAEGLDDMNAIRGLAERLRVDYVIWGRLQENDSVMRTVAFRQDDGVAVIQVKHEGSPDGLAKVVLQAAAVSADKDFADFANRILASADASILQTQLANDTPTTQAVLTAIGSLEQALGESIGSDQSTLWLERAEAAAKRAIAQEPSNGLANWVLSNVLFNQASALFRDGIKDRAKAAMKESKSALRLAYNQRLKIGSDALALEVEADYHLLVRRDAVQAIKFYSAMTEKGMPSDTRRRGHWMLSGVYAGDWGVDQNQINAVLARENSMAVMSTWPDSPEAVLLKQWLQWDDTADQTRHNFLPRINKALLGLDP